jgi:hypothetical protein
MRRSGFVGSVLGLVAAVLPLVVLAERAQGQCPVTPRCVPWNVQQAGATCSARVGTNYNSMFGQDACAPSAVSHSGELVADVTVGSPGVFFGVAHSSSDTALVWNADAHLSHPATAGSPIPYHAGAVTSWSDSLRIVGGQGGGMATFWFEVGGSTSAVASCAFGQVRIDGVDPFGGNAPTALTSFSVSKAFTFGSSVPLLVELLAYVESESDVLASAQSTFQLRLVSVSIAPPLGRFWIASTRCGIYPGATALPGARIHVDANALGANDGSSWTDAFPRLQDALALAAVTNPDCFGSSRVEVWTAAGTYRPDLGFAQTPGDLEASFYLLSQVDVIGGLPEGATSLAEQDVAANVSVLTGELGSPGIHARHVVRASNVTFASTSLDGFSVEKGRAVGAGSAIDGQGGGLLVVGGIQPVIVRRSRFTDHQARLSGGAIYSEQSSSTLELSDSSFDANSVTTTGGAGGGALHVAAGSYASLQRCEFTANSSANVGGAIANYSQRAMTIADCQFSANTALSGSGGAVGHFAVASGAPTVVELERCVFEANGAVRGGAVASERVEIQGCRFIANSATSQGGAVHLLGSAASPAKVEESEFDFNTSTAAGARGGAIYCTVTLDLDRCAVRANSAVDSGGGLFFSGGHLRMCSSLVTGNSAGSGGGGGVRILNATSATLTNCTLADNVAGFPYTGHDVRSVAISVRNSILDTGLNFGTCFSGGPLTSSNSLIELGSDTQNPRFRDRANGDYRLELASPAIDQGEAGLVLCGGTDIAGQPRFVDEPLVADLPGVSAPAVDLGALESQGYQRGIVYCTAGTTTNGCSPAIWAIGEASASSASSFVISASQVETNKQGLFFYGIGGAVAAPWGSGGSSYRCVSAPTQRTGVQNSGGTGACEGAFVLDWNAYRAAHPTALGMPFSSGDTCWLQGWFRDPPAVKSTNLTNALEFAHLP